MLYTLLFTTLLLLPTHSFIPPIPSFTRSTNRLSLGLADTATATPAPAPIVANDLGGSVLISGLCNLKTRTDQTLLDFLKESNTFTKITAFVDVAAASKKRLTSRSARYSGLLDVLEFKEAKEEGGLPSEADLAGVSAYVAYGVAASDVPGLITASQSAGVKFLIALVEAPTNVAEMKKAAKAVAAAPAHLQVTLLATPEIVDGAEGSAAYRVGPAIDLSLLAAKTIPRDEILRLLTECFSLPSTAGKALSFYGVPSDDDAAKYLKTLRSKGFSRTMEVNEMIGGGFENAEKEMADKKLAEEKAAEEKAAGKIVEPLAREEEIAALIEKGRIEAEEYREKQIEADAIEFLTKEWRGSYYSTNISVSEEEFIAKNMERGRKEALRMIKLMSGEKRFDQDDDEPHWMDVEDAAAEAAMAKEEAAAKKIMDETPKVKDPETPETPKE